MSGPRIPGLTFLQHLGSGGFADVFLYEQEWPRQRVAVKVVKPDVPLTAREKTLFTSEANAMARLADHPYIVSVVTAGVTDEGQGARPYLVMRYCPPPDLGARVRSQPMSVPDAISTGIKLASAVETAHRSGILHRDVKPSNVLVTSYSEPALTDFGIAGQIHEVDTDHEVRISYPWSPPEMLDGRSNGSVASDVYSLGATVWNLLTGRSPFSVPGGDNSSRALTARVLHSPPPPLQRPDAPPALDRLLAQCLAKRPELRPGSALELARELQRIEAASGYSRTPIAVEGDRPAAVVAAAPSEPGHDATALKPVSLDQTSLVRRPATPPEERTSEEETRSAPGRGTMVWAAISAVVVVGVGALLAVAAGGDEEPETGPAAEGSRTPDAVVQQAPLPAPELTGTRDGDRVVFRWRVVGGLRPGDTFLWTRPDTGRTGRGTERTVRFTAAGRTCLQVRLVRGDSSSPVAHDCVR